MSDILHGPVDHESILFQILVLCPTGVKALLETMITQLIIMKFKGVKGGQLYTNILTLS